MADAARLIGENVRRLSLKVRDDKYHFFVELVKSLDFVKIESEKITAAKLEKKDVIANIRQGFIDRKSIDAGTLKTFPAGDLFDE